MQFVGGDTAEGTLPLLRAFRRANKGALLAYSVEVDSPSASSHTSNEITPKDNLPHKQLIKEIIHSIDVAANFEDSVSNGGRRTWVAVKLVSPGTLVIHPSLTQPRQTALLPDARALTNLSKHIVQSRVLEPDQVPFPGCPRSSDLDVILDPTPLTPLAEKDIADLRDLYNDIHRVCEHAKTRGVKVIIDAEWRYVSLAAVLVWMTSSLLVQLVRTRHLRYRPLVDARI
jgi:proline dehydrogenase